MMKKIFAGIGAFVFLILLAGFLLPAGAELHHRISINVPPARVWTILSDLEGVKLYNHTVATAKYATSNRTGVGAARTCDLKDGSHVRETVIGWEPDQSITMELTESPWPVKNMTWKTEVRASGTGTLVTQVLRYEMKLGPIGRILNALAMKNMMNETLNQVFANLKSHAEK